MVKRRVLIVPKGEVEKHLREAERLGVSEILDGVPPRLEGKIESSLPVVYEEEEVERTMDIEEERKRRYRERLGRARGVEEKIEILLEYLGLGGV